MAGELPPGFRPDKPVAPAAGGLPPGFQVDKPAGPVEYGGSSDVVGALKGAGDTALAAGSNALVGGTLHPLAHLVSRIIGVDPKIASDYIEKNLVYHPQTEIGQGAARLAGQAVAPIGEAVNAVDQSMSGHPRVQSLVRTGAGLLNDVASLTPVGHGIANVVEHAGLPAVEPALAQAADLGPAARVAADNNFRVRPSDVQANNPTANVPGTSLQTLQDQQKFVKNHLLHNAGQATQLAGGEIGIPNATRIPSPDQLELLRAPHNANYQSAGRSAGTFQASPAVSQGLDAVVANAAPEYANQIQVATTPFRNGTLNGEQLMRSIQNLRNRATRGINSPGVAEQEYGYANRQIADTLENEIQRRLDENGVGHVGDRFRASRTALAKINDVADSTIAGQVDPQRLVQLRKRGHALSGGLNVIADVGEAFPDVMQHPQVTASMERSAPAPTKQGMVKSALKASVRSIPGLDVTTPGYTKKVGAMAERAPAPVAAPEPLPATPEPTQQVIGEPADYNFQLTPGAGAYNPETGLSTGEGPNIPAEPLGAPPLPPTLSEQLGLTMPHQVGAEPNIAPYSPVIYLGHEQGVDLRPQLGNTLAPEVVRPPVDPLVPPEGVTPAAAAPRVLPDVGPQRTFADAINTAQAMAEHNVPGRPEWPPLNLELPLGNALTGSDLPKAKPHIKPKPSKEAK